MHCVLGQVHGKGKEKRRKMKKKIQKKKMPVWNMFDKIVVSW